MPVQESPERVIVDLAPGQELLVRALVYIPNRPADLIEELRRVATNLWESVRNARSGNVLDLEELNYSLIPHTKFIDKLQDSHLPGEVVYEEVLNAYFKNPQRVVDAQTARDMAGIASTAFGFPPEELSQPEKGEPTE